MSEIYLSKLADSNAAWLSARQTLIAGNIANANSPGYKSVDVKPFSDAFRNAGLNVATTKTGHISAGLGNTNGVGTTSGTAWETYHSGGNISLPQEMIKAGEVSTSYQLNTGVMKAFHRMVISAFGN